MLIVVGRVAPAKGNLAVGQSDEAVVGDGYAVGIAAQIMQENNVVPTQLMWTILSLLRQSSMVLKVNKGVFYIFAAMSKLKFEQLNVDGLSIRVSRAKIPGGWLLASTSNSGGDSPSIPTRGTSGTGDR